MKMIPFMLLLVSCGASNGSRVQWGALDDFNKKETFLAAETLLICGHDKLRPVANDAIWEWNNARGQNHRLTNWASCDNRILYDASVKVGFGYCEPYVVGYHTQDGNHHDITICNGVNKIYWFKVMAHEIGHAYGLCDQYDPSDAGRIVFHPNCGWPRSTAPQRSIMGGLYQGSPDTLTDDDRAGIRFLSR
jgi:hypothetical protein